MEVVRINKATADLFVKEKHYSHRIPIFWEAFGLIENGLVVGVCVFGQPSPPTQRYAFKDRDFRIYELARLVVQTKTRNAASFLISRSIKMLSQQPCAIISFADGDYGHCGIIYQATNWLFTGEVKGHDTRYLVDGVVTYPLTLRDRGITSPKAWAKENGIQTIPAARKFRYFYLSGNKYQKKDMLSKLTYTVLAEYPKCDQSRYDDGKDILLPFSDACKYVEK